MIIKGINGEVLYESKAESIKEALEEAVRNKISLREARLDGICLDGACLDEALLEGASFQRSFLFEVSFHKAHLDGADFFLSNLGRASFKGAFLDRACFQNASLIGTVLDAELEEEIKKDLPKIPFVFISSIANIGLMKLKDLIWKQLND